MFNKENKEEDLKSLRNHVLNTIRRASNYEGSLIQKQLGLDSLYKPSDDTTSEKTVKKTEDKKSSSKPQVDLDDSDSPF